MIGLVKTALPDVWEITPRRFGDLRGFFSESYNAKVFSEQGINAVFVQDNHSVSEAAGTVRGLHFQSPPHAQAKLVRCGRGAVFDVAVDIRRGSPTYGDWVGAELSFETGKQLLVPAGFLHGFITLEPNSEIIYKCSNFYVPECDGAVRFDNQTIGINWPVTDTNPVLSDKDSVAPFFSDFDSAFIFEEI